MSTFAKFSANLAEAISFKWMYIICVSPVSCGNPVEIKYETDDIFFVQCVKKTRESGGDVAKR